MKLIKDLGMQYPTETSKTKKRYCIYKCKCGKEFKTSTRANLIPFAESCKYCANKKRAIKHGKSNTKLYQTWSNQKQRCNNNKHPRYNDWGGRGIKFSNDFFIFENWLKYVLSLDNSNKKNYTLDRINNDGNYEKNNLRWIKKSIQSQNTRLINSRNTTGYRGVSFTRNKSKFRTRICIDGKQIEIGRYNTKLEAAYEYDRYVIENNYNHTINGVIYSNIQKGTIK